jgi:hypothetical protein
MIHREEATPNPQGASRRTGAGVCEGFLRVREEFFAVLPFRYDVIPFRFIVYEQP